MDNYQRRDNESFLDWKLRLITDKIEKTSDLDWVEIRDLLGLDCSPDHLRKTAYGIYEYKSYIEEKVNENISDEKVFKQLENKQIELQKEKNKIQSLRLDLSRIIRETSRSELLVEEFINAIKQCENIPTPEFKELKQQDQKKAYILSFADSHFGKEFVSITNNYDLNVVYNRFNKLLNEVIEIIEECNIKHLIVLALGDLIEGMCLRISQLSNLKIGMTQQTIQFMRFIVSWLNKLSEYVEITYYQTVYANHSQIRPFGTKANDFAREDMEQIIFAYITDKLESNDRITVFETIDKYVIFDVFKYKIIACHGHDIKNPKSFIKDISNKYRTFFDYAFFAHKHSGIIQTVGEGEDNNCEIINIPSIMGSDEYADDLLVGSKAGATLIEFTEKQGKRKTYDIILN